MKKLFKRKSAVVEPVIQPDLSAAIGRIQQQLTFLEKKLDTLIAQSAAPRPAQRFDNSFRRNRGGRENNFREKSFTKAICAECHTECELPFKPTGDRPVYCKECFARRRDGGGVPPGEERASGGRKKPSFRKRSRDRG